MPCIAVLQVNDEVEEAVRFADESPKPSKSQLLENVFADPRGFGIAPDGRYRCVPLCWWCGLCNDCSWAGGSWA